MSDALIVGDVHLSDRPPSSRTDGYAEEILAKLAWCAIYANHPGPGQSSLPMVLAGDLFHIKVPWRTSYGLVQRTHDILRTVERGVWVVPGNHDLSHDRMESLASQPLGALCRMGNVHLLDGYDDALPAINGIPWHGVFDGGDWVSVLERYTGEWLDNDRIPNLVVTHAPIFPGGKEPGVYASIPASQWAAVLGAADIHATYYGHIHEQHGEYEVGSHIFANFGAISRGSIHEESVNRWPAVTQWAEASGRFYRIDLPKEVVKPPEEVFRFAEVEQHKATESMTRAFEAALGEVKLANLTTEEVLAYVRREDVPPQVLTVIESVLEMVL
jgi:3',5'-cyclic AMP phosphodiesterase CpdA